MFNLNIFCLFLLSVSSHSRTPVLSPDGSPRVGRRLDDGDLSAQETHQVRRILLAPRNILFTLAFCLLLAGECWRDDVLLHTRQVDVGISRNCKWMDENHLERDCVSVLAFWSFFQVVPTFTMYAAALPHVAHLKTKTSQPSFFMSDELKLVRLHNLNHLHYFIDFLFIVFTHNTLFWFFWLIVRGRVQKSKN